MLDEIGRLVAVVGVVLVAALAIHLPFTRRAARSGAPIRRLVGSPLGRPKITLWASAGVSVGLVLAILAYAIHRANSDSPERRELERLASELIEPRSERRAIDELTRFCQNHYGTDAWREAEGVVVEEILPALDRLWFDVPPLRPDLVDLLNVLHHPDASEQWLRALEDLPDLELRRKRSVLEAWTSADEVRSARDLTALLTRRAEGGLATRGSDEESIQFTLLLVLSLRRLDHRASSTAVEDLVEREDLDPRIDSAARWTLASLEAGRR